MNSNKWIENAYELHRNQISSVGKLGIMPFTLYVHRAEPSLGFSTSVNSSMRTSRFHVAKPYVSDYGPLCRNQRQHIMLLPTYIPRYVLMKEYCLLLKLQKSAQYDSQCLAETLQTPSNWNHQNLKPEQHWTPNPKPCN